MTKKLFSDMRPIPGEKIIVSWEDGSPPVRGYIKNSDNTILVNSDRPLGSKCSEHELRKGCVWWKASDPDAPQLDEFPGERPEVDNPKDVIGSKKLPFSSLPWAVIAEAAAGMGEGAIKYGKHNYESVGVRHSIYFDATLRHLIADFLGEEIDPESGIPHITKAISSLMVLRDAQIYGKCTDDRPQAPPGDHLAEAKALFASLIYGIKDCGKHYDRESLRKRGEL